MSINQKSGRKTFRRRFVSGFFFVSPCPPECNFQSETNIEPDLRLNFAVPDRRVPSSKKNKLPVALHDIVTSAFSLFKLTFGSSGIGSLNLARSAVIYKS